MIQTYRIEYAAVAVKDLLDIYHYIADELLAEENATDQVNRIRTAIRTLDAFPKRHAVVEWEPWHSMEMRMLPIDHFAAYYLVDAEKRTVSIVRIFYNGRNVEEIVSR